MWGGLRLHYQMICLNPDIVSLMHTNNWHLDFSKACLGKQQRKCYELVPSVRGGIPFIKDRWCEKSVHVMTSAWPMAPAYPGQVNTFDEIGLEIYLQVANWSDLDPPFSYWWRYLQSGSQFLGSQYNRYFSVWTTCDEGKCGPQC